MQREYWRLAAICVGVAAGLYMFIYEGPGNDFLRYYIGDVVVVFIMGLFFGAWFRRLWIGPIVALSIGVFLECIQIFLTTQGNVRDSIFGAVFDWLDIVAYGCGALVAYAFQSFMAGKNRNLI
ncbi:MAG: DUF2809 domain-containing protein [Patescibacteria group bacterium]|jgi:hypothetical protein